MPETKTINSPVINLIDESFDSEKSNTYHLSILTSENSFSFCVLDTNTSKYLVLQSHTLFPLEEMKEGLLGCNSFKSVTCAVAHNKFTIIPSSLFDEENKKPLLEFNHRVDSEEKIHSDNLLNLDAKNIFTISRNLESEIRK